MISSASSYVEVEERREPGMTRRPAKEAFIEEVGAKLREMMPYLKKK